MGKVIENLEQTIMVLKVKSDKSSLKAMAYQIAQIATECTKHNVKIIDCAITFGGPKDIIRELKKIDAQKRFDSVIIYSPNQICKNEAEYQSFVDAVQTNFQAGVRCIRTPN